MKMPPVLARGTRPPTFLDPMEFKAGITGVTKLKENRYTSRYQVGSGYAVTGRGDIINKMQDPCLAGDKLGINKKNRVLTGDKPGTAPEKLPRGHRINKRLVRARLSAMVNTLQDKRVKAPRLHFITVTFKAGTADGICYQLLNTWLTSLRLAGKLLSYLWIAERQENGTIHYHLAVPHYLNVPAANRILRGHILDLEKKGHLPGWTRAEIRRYNGVDIAKDRTTRRVVNFASPKKARALARYLSKYLTKNETELPHAAWHCSRDWSALILGMCFTRPELASFVTGAMLDPKKLEGDFAIFHGWANFKPPQVLVQHLARMNYDLLRNVTGREGNYLYCLN